MLNYRIGISLISVSLTSCLRTLLKPSVIIIALFASLNVIALPSRLFQGEEVFYNKSPEHMIRILKAREILDAAEFGADREPYREANAIIRSVLMFDPEFAPAHREFGRLIWLTARDHAERLTNRAKNHVLRAFKEAERNSPSYPQLELDLARFELFFGPKEERFDTSSELAEQVDIQGVTQIQIKLFDLDYLLESRNHQEALELLQELDDKYGGIEGFPYRAARVYLRNKRFDDAEKAFLLAEELGYNRAAFYRDWLNLYLYRKHPESAQGKLFAAQNAGLPEVEVVRLQNKIDKLRN